MTLAWIGLGSNLGDRQRTMEQALRHLEDHSGIRVLAVSAIYETDPVGVLDQPPFLNAAARLATSLRARALLDALLETEREMGRRRERRWGPRNIDLDLLLYGDDVIREEGLIAPHLLLAERLFVLAPLCDLDPEAIHPVLNRTMRDLYADLCAGNPLKPVEKLTSFS
ncbi:MAG: 2-amino-4-hydroxy-6-hydroxymethyldihydropteridine diphosphokinase [Candidatus Latescibacteria bacterium]|nr:2-amino-4-hydroxy-6-hydroxymethyldihydropteridine diphosphokinase [Candidatus Latescibacterota bacterium]